MFTLEISKENKTDCEKAVIAEAFGRVAQYDSLLAGRILTALMGIPVPSLAEAEELLAKVPGEIRFLVKIAPV